MGLLCGGINEIIATTVSADKNENAIGRCNAAPIGIINRENSRDNTSDAASSINSPGNSGNLKMVLFHGTHTAENIARDGFVVANFIYDPVIYVKTAFGDIDDSYFASGRYVCRRDMGITEDEISFCYLKNAEAWILFSAEIERDTGEALIVNLVPVREHKGSLRLHPVNRGFSSIIEATVHATRYVMNRDPKLLDLINHHASLVRKCGGRIELEALEILMDSVNI